jgi:NADPH-dependent curcumin reductase CurA
MVTTRQWLLAHKPRDEPKLDGPEQTFQLVDNVELPPLQAGELLVKLISLSNDPAQRGWIDPDIPAERLYVPPVPQGAPMFARGLAEVVESQSPHFQKGDHVLAQTGWSEYAVVPAAAAQPAHDLPGGKSKTHYLGALGMTGYTAYFGLTAVVHAAPDDIVVVSGAAGATGSMAVQIAKHIIGCKRVIGIAGSDAKCRWVERLGADACLNYKSPSFRDDLCRETPGPHGFADVYFDNVGGDILDFMLTRMARHGRVAACGAIAQYNTAAERTAGLKNWFEIIMMRIQIRGFIVIDYMKDFARANDVFVDALAKGKITLENAETVVPAKFEEVPLTWMKLFDGSNQGKLITQIV